MPPPLQFTLGQVLSGHSGAVTCLTAIALFSDEDDPVINTLIASGSADSTVCIWERLDPNGMVLYMFVFCSLHLLRHYFVQLNSLYFKLFRLGVDL